MSAEAHAAVFALSLTVGALLLALAWLDPDDARVRRGFFRAFVGLKALYFGWRVTQTMPWSAGALRVAYSVFFLVLEVLVTVALYRWLATLLSHRTRSHEADAHADWFLGCRTPPRVAILIPTYNEPWNVVEKTLVGALLQTYPNVSVHLLDDGRRPWLERRARALGVDYSVRADNRHAKAGNLNAGLWRVLDGAEPPEFIAVLDADFVARPRFVERALSLLHEPSVGIVQTPQFHHNPDPFQRKFRATAGWPDTQRFAFGCFLPARDAEGGAYCCGTSFVARAAALQKIGGFPTESVTEDVLTSVKMGMNGYKTVYLGELLTTGLAAEGLREYLTQRGRWCLGTVQLGLFLFGLGRGERSVWARFWGSEGCFRWGYTSLMRLVFLMVPVLYWFTGVAPFDATTEAVLLFAVPVMILQRVFVAWISRGTQFPLVYEASSMLANFVVVRALFKGLFQRGVHRFEVTDKGQGSDELVIHWHTLRWFAGYAAVLVFSMIYAHLSPERRALAGGFEYVNLLWSFINLALVGIAAAPCFEEPRRRAEERYPAAERCTIRLEGSTALIEAEVVDLSVCGARVRPRSEKRLLSGESGMLTFDDGLQVAFVVVRDAGSAEDGIRFVTTDAERRALIARIYCTARYVIPEETGRVWPTLGALLRTAFR